MKPADSMTAVWRTKATPLVPGAGRGPLRGESAAVKDLFAVAGEPIGAGNPLRLAQQPVQPRHAAVVQALIDAGADIAGISQTDEFAWSLAGTNAHYGTPPNPGAPGRISGGSSNGSASAVALGEVSIGLGTDTGGSIRVPAAYQGLWGIRTTQDLLPLTGVQPLAQSFDTVGWVTRTHELLARVTQTVTPTPKKVAPTAPSALGGMGTGSIPTVPKGPVAWEADRPLGELRMVPDLFSLADEDVAAACRDLLIRLEAQAGGSVAVHGPGLEALRDWRQAFTVILSREAWANHGEWVAAHWEDMTPEVGARFRAASEYTSEDEAAARKQHSRIREIVRGWVGDGVLALPSATTVAPLLDSSGEASNGTDSLRQRHLLLTTLGSLAGLPVVSVPTVTAGGLPTGLSLMGPAGSDKALIAYAAQLA
ncbi:amidase family protein [Nesterenkonia natronophila]|uniref:Amidase domain-containing protein n=1 Tax=Nesterenkonia natronophila TaxID=2174932 RepID=A0A3A4FKB7_9MICC|nr:amidase family protein [Nesterenkonia natronophila]RJN32845.1 hypothetical protein D3250_03250 [Nesterenkonia natronophila]